MPNTLFLPLSDMHGGRLAGDPEVHTSPDVLYLGVVFNGMCIGQEPSLIFSSINHEASTVGRELPIPLPGE